MSSEHESVEMSLSILDLSNDIMQLTESIDSITMNLDQEPSSIDHENVNDSIDSNTDILNACLDSFQVLEETEANKLKIDTTPENPNVETMTTINRVSSYFPPKINDSDKYMLAALKRYKKDKRKQDVSVIPPSMYKSLKKSKEIMKGPTIISESKEITDDETNQISKPALHHNFNKFKYWKCKLCDKEGIPFKEMKCTTCGRSKKFKPLHERDYSSTLVSQKINPKREEAEFLKPDKEEVSISDRLERQYLYTKHDFEVDTRQKLVQEVEELLSSIRDWI